MENINTNDKVAAIKHNNDEDANSWFIEYQKQMIRKAPEFDISLDRDVTTESLTEGMVVILRNIAKPKPITPEFLVYRDYKAVSSYRIAHELIKSFKDNNIIDNNNYLYIDPRSNKVNWRDIVYKAIPEAIKQEGDSLVADQSALCELMNVAYGQHEFTDEYLTQTLDFFEMVSPFNTDEDW